jgi:predicted LPLAT superfamily acyltransferase
MQAYVFFVTCLRTGWNTYEVHFEKMKNVECKMKNDGEAVCKTEVLDILDEYVRFLEKETLDYPDQWYQFYRFF